MDFNDTFRLYLVTRNPEPYLPPDARSLLAVANFTVTRSGLEGGWGCWGVGGGRGGGRG